MNPKDKIEGLARGLGVLEAFSEARPRMTAQQTADCTGLTRTAARSARASYVWRKPS
jgi:IclR family transcriptional regulator, pca regulon regulatory protein